MKSLATSPLFYGVPLFLSLWCGLSTALGADLHLLRNAETLKMIPLPDLHHHTAEKLCFSLDNTQILDQFKFLWSFIQPQDDQKIKVTQQNCHVYRWKKCSGEVRFPLSSDCGFFELVQLPADKCEQTIKAKAQENEGESTYLNHARAVQLCAVLSQMPVEKEAEVNYTPVRVEPEESSVNALVQKCVFWKYAACGATSRDGCDQWTLAINPVAECKPYLQYYAADTYNKTEIQKLTKDMEVADFIQSTTKEQEDVDFGSELDLLKDLISCKSTGKSTTCQVMKEAEPSFRPKRELSHTNNIREKRQYGRRWRGRGGHYRGGSNRCPWLGGWR